MTSGGRIVLELPVEPTLADLPELPLEDGDRISVPQRPAMVSGGAEKDLKDWRQIFYQFGLGAAALKVIGD